MQNLIARFVKDESGATAIEYGLIASLISVAIITAASNLGKNVSSTFSTVAANMTATK
jgi:pilus assembly protein Flp/PilA